jgi:hypothetical protein
VLCCWTVKQNYSKAKYCFNYSLMTLLFYMIWSVHIFSVNQWILISKRNESQHEHLKLPREIKIFLCLWYWKYQNRRLKSSHEVLWIKCSLWNHNLIYFYIISGIKTDILMFSPQLQFCFVLKLVRYQLRNTVLSKRKLFLRLIGYL